MPVLPPPRFCYTKLLSVVRDHRSLIPTATLLEHTLLTQGFMSTSKAVSLVAGDRKIVILRGQFWAKHSSVAVGLYARNQLLGKSKGVGCRPPLGGHG